MSIDRDRIRAKVQQQEHTGPQPQSLTPRPAHPSAPASPQQGAEQGGGRADLTAGLANVLTHQAGSSIQHVQTAEEFAVKSAQAVAHRIHRLTSGEVFTQAMLSELDRLQHECPYDGYQEADWSALEAVIAEAKKPLPPAPKPNFLPSATK